ARIIADAAALLLRHPDKDRGDALDLRIALYRLVGAAGKVEKTGPPLEHHGRCFVGTAFRHDHHLEAQHVDAFVDGAAVTQHKTAKRHRDRHSQGDTRNGQPCAYWPPPQILDRQHEIPAKDEWIGLCVVMHNFSLEFDCASEYLIPIAIRHH